MHVTKRELGNELGGEFTSPGALRHPLLWGIWQQPRPGPGVGETFAPVILYTSCSLGGFLLAGGVRVSGFVRGHSV